MKLNKLYIVLLAFLYLLSGCSNEKEEYNCFIAGVPDAYDYPIKPGTPEWEKLTTSYEMDSVLQIPKDVLNSISTEGLIETVLNYPKFGDLYFLDNYQFSFDRLKEHFNGFQELLTRRDAGIKLFSRYKLMNPACNKNNWPSITGPGSSVSFSFAFIEIIIAQYDILNQFNNEQIKPLLKETIIKYQEKTRYNYSVFSKKHTVLIAGRIMYIKNYSPFMEEYKKNIYVKTFIDKVMLYNNFETLDLIIDYANDFYEKYNKR
ncbi:MAG: hypothetical protein GX432_13570 [Candidatus Atribacteria bacterium]|nr:hypothetical protein [Candidatus Atribacteria bacterium]